MSSAQTVRLQIESALAHRVPSALTPSPRAIRPVMCTGIKTLDELLLGGLPIGAVTEIIGPVSSGRTSLSLSFLAQVTGVGKVCAWVDVSDTLQPESAAAVGIDLTRLLWVRCGVNPKQNAATSLNFAVPKACLAPPTIKKGLHGGGHGTHPRMEAKGMSEALGGFLHTEAMQPRSAEVKKRADVQTRAVIALSPPQKETFRRVAPKQGKPWSRIDQALRVTDLLLQAGGFSSIVLDMGDLAPEVVSKVPLATWFRYRAAAERSQVSIVLLTQYPSAKSSAGLVLRMESGEALLDEPTVFSGIRFRAGIRRERFIPTNNVISIRKPPQRENGATWSGRAVWTGNR